MCFPRGQREYATRMISIFVTFSPNTPSLLRAIFLDSFISSIKKCLSATFEIKHMQSTTANQPLVFPCRVHLQAKASLALFLLPGERQKVAGDMSKIEYSTP